MNVHFMSLRLDWQTPKHIIEKVREEFGDFFDPCPSNPSFNGLDIEWRRVNYVNPPYGREIGKWCKKAYEEWQKGKTVVMLVPSRTDTKWWHDYIMKASQIRFIKGRLRFDDQKNPAPFPSALVIFRRRMKKKKGGTDGEN